MFNFVDSKITLEAETHTYCHQNFPGFKFTSGTTLLKPYFEAFNGMEIATNLCNTNYKYMDMNPEDLVKAWNDLRDQGTKIHAEIEDYIKDGTAPTENKAKNGVKWLDKYVKKMDLAILPEVIIYNIKLGIAGTIDLLTYDEFSDSYEIIDWKSNKKIDTTSFNGKMGIHPITEDLEDCKLTRYALQLSLYRYILETCYNLTISGQMLVHLTDKKCRKIRTPYYKEHVIQIINNKKEIECNIK
tara:strand:+ start:341 stop:1069 length:729 start_codon:yes stop_codon:yes gene_type:complete